MKKLLKNNHLFLLIIFLFFLMSGIVNAQFYFGKNKVQYTRFDWRVMETEHFRVYFYIEEEIIAKMAARIAEDSYHILASRFKHEIYIPIPLIVYSSPGYFSQTNVIPNLLPESVGGFTEFMKGRVVLPFHGSYFDFTHVLGHELVHVFTLSKLESVISKQKYIRMAPPPLWFIEGLAEYWSTEWGSEADMILKDMVLAGRLYSISRLWEISGSYYMYKLGQSICQFINDEYGSDKLVLILENWWKGDNFNEIVRATIGQPLDAVSKKWEYSLKKKYFPQFSDRGLAGEEARQLTKGGFAVKAVPINLKDGSNSGDWIIFKANKLGYSGLYMMPPDGEAKKLFTLLKGEQSASFESLHLLQSGIDANDKGQILFSSKSEGADVLYLFDLAQRKIIRKYEIPDLTSIVSPRYSPDNKWAVFSGSGKSGMADLFLLNMESGKTVRVTDDIYYDIDPVFSYSGDSIIFSSDRCLEGDAGATNLYKIAISGGSPIQLTSGKWRDITPDVSDSVTYFASDRDGAFNIYGLNMDGTSSRITSLLTGAYDPRLTPNRKEVIFSGYQNFEFNIYRLPVTDSIRLPESKPESGEIFWRPALLSGKYVKSSVKYKTKYSFDIAQSAVSYDPVYGSIGGVQMALSDMLGNNIIYFLLTNTAESKNEFLYSFNAAVTYLNQKRRLNWGFGVYHLYDEYYNDYDGYYYERLAGGLGHINYPLSKFNRVEATSYLRYSDKNLKFFKSRREALLFSNYLSFVSDNSINDISGPIEGHRYNVTAGFTGALDRGRFFNRLGLIDIRHYLRLGKYSAFASRLFAFSSSGAEPQRIYFGGSWSFRGYSRQAFYNRHILFSSNELRFPLIDNLTVGFPFGDVGLQAIRGVVFFDVGSAWDNHFDQFLGSFGTGFRVALGRIVLLRFDFSRTTDFSTISPRTKVDFFFGWNF
ncbi:MAG: hypothetical protein NTV06_00915 [candidate division Zixibacteria bacterium]|nr:hypothetical protein [candidate division Zixibacteria bacterium]